MGLVLGGRRPVVLTGHADASWADDQTTQRSSQGYTFSLGSGSVSWRSTRSSSVLSSSCEAEIYAGAMATQELRWLTYLLTDLGEQPRSPPVLYVDNKAMLALCREHRLEHRTKHVALRYFLARELQQRGQLRLAYVASEAKTADIFTKALAPGFATCTQHSTSSFIPVSSQGPRRGWGRAGTGSKPGKVRDGAATGPGQFRDGAATGPGQGRGRGRSRTGPQRGRDRVGAGAGLGRGRDGAGTGSGPGQVRDRAVTGPGRRGRAGAGSQQGLTGLQRGPLRAQRPLGGRKGAT
ncbi:unnamed protein product [Closterium sp. NIES-54]